MNESQSIELGQILNVLIQDYQLIAFKIMMFEYILYAVSAFYILKFFYSWAIKKVGQLIKDATEQ